MMYIHKLNGASVIYRLQCFVVSRKPVRKRGWRCGKGRPEREQSKQEDKHYSTSTVLRSQATSVAYRMNTTKIRARHSQHDAAAALVVGRVSKVEQEGHADKAYEADVHNRVLQPSTWPW